MEERSRHGRSARAVPRTGGPSPENAPNLRLFHALAKPLPDAEAPRRAARAQRGAAKSLRALLPGCELEERFVAITSIAAAAVWLKGRRAQQKKLAGNPALGIATYR